MNFEGPDYLVLEVLATLRLLVKKSAVEVRHVSCA
jgi:hypothetical protein